MQNANNGIMTSTWDYKKKLEIAQVARLRGDWPEIAETHTLC